MLKNLCLIFLCCWSLQAVEFRARFESSEHIAVGDNLTLISKSQILHLPNGLAFTFGEIISMPDFYGVVGEPVSFGKTPKERQARFRAAFHEFANNQDSVDEAQKIRAAIYSNIPRDEQHVKWNCLTGGACSGPMWWLSPGRYLLLAETDYDHFGDNAVKAYLAGHEVALQEALEAGETQDQTRLEQAYAMDAFACHFLTDRFSSGHLRTPRVELPDTVTPSLIGSLLITYMHDEESFYGLHVHNQRGDQWVAYGDGKYWDDLNQQNRAIMRESVQRSVDDISDAFSKGYVPSEYAQLALLPQVNESGLAGTQDIAPMFYWDAQSEQLLRRDNLSDPYDRNWTSNWYGWSTAALLQGLKAL